MELRRLYYKATLESGKDSKKILETESKLVLFAIQQANNPETRCWGKDYDFIQKASQLYVADYMFQNNILSGSFIEQRWGGEEIKSRMGERGGEEIK